MTPTIIQTAVADFLLLVLILSIVEVATTAFIIWLGARDDDTSQ